MVCPGRHTITRLWASIPITTRRSYHAYARLLRRGRWDPDGIFQRLLGWVVTQLAPEGRLVLLVDDTLVRKSGRKIDGVGIFRDVVAGAFSTRMVTALGLNVVVLGLRLQPPWKGEPLALPVGIRLHRKRGPTQTDLAAEMARKVAQWLPEREFWLVADGAYSRLLRMGLPRTQVITRLRSNAALYELPAPRRPHQKGRPRKKGQRLPVPALLAAGCQLWRRKEVPVRTQIRGLELCSRQVLWYQTCPQPVLVVMARTVDGPEEELYLATNAVEGDPAEVVSLYADRWAIEVCFRDVKQLVGGGDPQSWVRPAPERAVALASWMYSAVWAWFSAQWEQGSSYWPYRPWYLRKRTPAFADALAALRRDLWAERVSGTTTPGDLNHAILQDLLEALALAA